MGVKILLADDSPTVHKVIKIILANEPYEIVDCARESELLPKLAQLHPELVFLDFNFSESLTGYDLCRAIKDKAPKSKVLMMYGTFDSVDENALNDCGADQHVIKPFDTNRFIFQIRAMADNSQPEPADEWNVRETVERSTPDVGRMLNETVENLDDSLSDWGMSVPGVIGKSGGSLELPPVIDAPHAIAARPAPVAVKAAPVASAVDAGARVPDDSDLEYPDMGGPSLEMESASKPKSKLISLNELNIEEEEETKSSALELMSYTGMDDEVKNIEDQIRDEVEADLWSVDSFQEANPRLAVVKEAPLTVALDHDHDEELSFNASQPAHRPAPSAQAAPATFDVESLKPLIQELVKQAVREYCEKQVDKVAWEVIPDLAENLIRKELQNLAVQAMDDN